MLRTVIRKTICTAAGLFLLALAVPSSSEAALIIRFDNVTTTGGTITDLGGGNFTGDNILFDQITLEDDVTHVIFKTVQCGLSNAQACELDFSTITGSFVLTAPGGLYDAGADGVYNGVTGPQISPNGTVVLSGVIATAGAVCSPFTGECSFSAFGTDTKDPNLLAFFGVTANNLQFANTEIYFDSNGNVTQEDLINHGDIISIPEPGMLTLFGLGLLGVGRRFRRRA